MKTTNYILFTILFFTLSLFTSCKKDYFSNSKIAYFGGEVINPTSRFVLFCKDNEVIDTISLKTDNTFFKKFDSLTPGLYSFKHNPEYQYVYFEKNDSIMVHIDANNFDESIVFCGKGAEKNNFLMEMYLKNEKDKNKMFPIFESNFTVFNNQNDKLNSENQKIYKSKKNQIDWSSDFDLYARCVVDFPYFTKKEMYPSVHKLRTGKEIESKIAKDYYCFRKDIDLNATKLIHFSPYINYINQMLTNICFDKKTPNLSEAGIALQNNINKLKLTDSLIKNEEIKNVVLNNIAFYYLLEDQNMINNQAFIETFHHFSTDKSHKNEITNLGNAIQLLTIGKFLPEIKLIDENGKMENSDKLISGKTIVFFWTESLNSHFEGVHKKAMELQKKHPDYKFIAINIDTNPYKWKTILMNYKFSTIKEYHCVNFEDLKNKWAITKIHRTIIINSDKTIKNAFTNMFDANFENQL